MTNFAAVKTELFMFQRIIKLSIEHKLVVGVLTCLLVAWGAWSLVHLPFDATPDITNNQV